MQRTTALQKKEQVGNGIIRTEYLVDTQGELSRILTVTTSEGGNTTSTDYIHAEGLLYQETEGSRQYYHYDRQGSTVLTTDADGREVHRFAYGTYGELLTAMEKEIKEVRFLYNGKYGVETDTEGLYYMRARYYNTDIRRFLNMDTVKGDLGNTQSLNRYAYVEGNSVNLFDPFGLSPMDSDGWMRLLHSTLNILGFVPGSFGMVMDAVNAAIYLCEGDYANAICSAVSVFCGVGGSLLAKFGGSAGKTAVNIFQAGSGAYGAVMCVSNAVKGAAAIKKEYQENGGHITLNMVCNAMSVVENGVGFYMSGKSFASGTKGIKSSGLGKGLKGSGFGGGLKNRISGLGKKIRGSVKRMDNGGYLNLSRFGSNKSVKTTGSSRTRWGAEHGRGNVKHNNAIESELDKAYMEGALDIRKNRVQRDANGNRVYASDGKYTRPDASYVLNGKRYNTNYISNHTLDDIEELNRELEAFQRMVDADPNAINRLVFNY